MRTFPRSFSKLFADDGWDAAAGLLVLAAFAALTAGALGWLAS